jgi:hypothetical protein
MCLPGHDSFLPDIFVFFYFSYQALWPESRGSAVDMVTGYGMRDRGIGIRVSVGSRIFSASSRPALGSTQPPLQWVPGALFQEVKKPGREAAHTPTASAEVKQIRSPIRLHGVVLN